MRRIGFFNDRQTFGDVVNVQIGEFIQVTLLNNIMAMEKRLTVLCLLLTMVSMQALTVNDNPNKQQVQKIEIRGNSQLADYTVRSEYWYYLRNADILFSTHIDSAESQIHFAIYRNLIGTFFTIVSIKPTSTKVQINTFIRLGSGYSSQATPDDPIKIKPFFIQFKLNDEQYKVSMNEFGSFTINGFNLPPMPLIDQPVQLEGDLAFIDQYLKETYWYHLQDAQLITDQQIITDSIHYYLLTYSSEITGSFLIIASVKESSNVKIHTFVKLGDAIEKPKIQDDFFFVLPGLNPNVIMT